MLYRAGQVSVFEISSNERDLTCVHRLAAATFGWPMMVQDECTIPLPILSDNALSLEAGNTLSGVDTSSDLCVFRSTCDLFGILGEVLSTIYQNNGALLRTTAAQNQASQTLSHIMGLNGRLDAYLISTPPYIRSFIEETEPPTANTVSDTILIHQQAISCRYRYCHRRSALLDSGLTSS